MLLTRKESECNFFLDFKNSNKNNKFVGVRFLGKMQLLFFVKTTQHEVCFQRAPKLFCSVRRPYICIGSLFNCSFLCVKTCCEFGIVFKQQWLPGGWIQKLNNSVSNCALLM